MVEVHLTSQVEMVEILVEKLVEMLVEMVEM